MFQVRLLSRMWLPILSCLIVSVAGQIPSYLITCPSIVHVGVAESVGIQLHGATQPVIVKVYCYDVIGSKACSSVTSFTLNAANEYREIKTITISTKAVKDLRLWRRRRKYVYLAVESRQLFPRRRMVPLKMSSKRGYIFIQTDKPVYTPDQNVLYRVFTLDHYMRPVNNELKLSLFNSRNMELMTFERMSGNIKSHRTKIPDNEQPGIWRIEAEFADAPMSKATAEFEVKEFVLPRFEVKVRANKMFYLVTRDAFLFTVTATHTYGETVYGEVHVRYGIIYEDESSTRSWKLGQKHTSSGGTSWVIATEDLLRKAQLRSSRDLLGLNLYLVVTVVESGSDVMEEVEIRSIKFVSSPYVLDLSKTARHFIPGAPFHILASVSYPDGTPAVSVPVKLEEGPAVETDQRGLAIIERDVPADSSILSLKVIAGEGSVGREASVTAEIYHSPSQSYLHIQAPRTMVKVGEQLDIEFRAITQGHEGKIDHIYYIVTSKGRILLAERLVKGNPTRLQLLVVPDMIPTFRLLAYYYTRSAGTDEMVANSAWVDVEDKCRGRVEMRDLDEEYKPGSKFDLHFSTNDAANVSFVAVDSAMYILNNKYRLAPRKVFEAMNSYDLGCFYGGGAKSSDVFMDAGLSFLSDVDVSGFRQDYTCTKRVETQRREIRLQDQFSGILSEYSGLRLRKCCQAGISKNLMSLSCEQRAEHVRESDCRQVFRKCCEHTLEDRRTKPRKKGLGRSQVDPDVVDIGEQPFDELSVHVRSVFPQSWLWETFSAGQAGNHRITSDIPDSITTWEIQAVGMFENQGFCVEEPKKMKVFRPFFLSMNLPYSVKRNEQMIVKVTLYNYSPQTVSVLVYMKKAEGLCSSLESRDNAETLTVPANGARSIDLTLVPLVVGSIPIHVFAFSHSGSQTDAILKHLRVLYEGNVEQKEWSIALSSKEKRSIEILERPPTNVVPDARNYLYIKSTGTILGNAVENSLSAAGIDKLIRVPTGCAEQTAMHMAPTVFAVEYLDQTEQWLSLTAERKDEARSHIETGYNRILGFKKDDGSYGLWLTYPSSTWLTAFIVKIFSIVKVYLSVNERIVSESVSYLIRAQKSDGHFEDPHPVLMKVIQGGVGEAEGEVSLTAFVAVALQHFLNAFPQSNNPSPAKLRESIGKAVGYLNQELPNIRQPYAVAITAYALAFSPVDTAKVQEAEQKLRDIAFDDADGGGRYWSADGGSPGSAGSPPVETALTVETTAYGLLQALARGHVEYSKPVVEWLTQQQNYGGGFQSTQDTVVALEALSKYHNALYERGEDVNLQLRFSSVGKSSQVLLSQKTVLTQEELMFPLDEKVVVEVSGKGKGKLSLRSISHIMEQGSGSCDRLHLKITIKNHVKYAKSIRKQGGMVGSRKRSVPDASKCQTVFYEVCMWQDGVHENVLSVTGMAVVDITLLSGLAPDTKYLDQMANGVEEYISSYEVKKGKLLLYLETIPYNVTCLVFPARQIVRLGLMQPADATLYDFYDPTTRCTVSYRPPEQNTMTSKLCEGPVCTCAAGGCPHEQDILPDNLLGDDRTGFACYNPIVDYVFVAQVLNKTSLGYFDKYTMSVRIVYWKNDGDHAGGDEVRTFLHRSSCRLQLREGTEYLLMGKSGNIKHGAGIAQYLLSDTTWIEAIPSQTTCGLLTHREHCKQVKSFIEEFTFFGCEM